jgi:hypothetical protein
MNAQVYEGYFINGFFYSTGKKVELPERQRVLVTVFDEKEADSEDEDMKSRIMWLAELDRLKKLSAHEELPDLPPRQPMRPPILFTDEG